MTMATPHRLKAQHAYKFSRSVIVKKPQQSHALSAFFLCLQENSYPHGFLSLCGITLCSNEKRWWNMLKIIPSLTSGSYACLGENARRLAPVGRLHLDIEDGTFSHGITLGTDAIRDVAPYTDAELDVHLMVNNPDDYFQDLLDCGVRRIAVQVEACNYPSRQLNSLRKMGVKAGLALRYKTDVSVLENYVDLLDYVLLWTNESDCDALAFKPHSLERIRRAKKIVGSDIEVWADGGVKKELLKAVKEAGADATIMGRAFFEAEDPVAWHRDLLVEANRQ